MLPANSSLPRQIALVDCNNFYVSCERVFHPAWNNRPVGVLSSNDGCIVARSNELKAAGIPMGAPYFKHKKQLAALNAVMVSSNYMLYGDMSARVMSLLSQFTPDIDVYSIDEAWLDLTGFNPDTLVQYGRDIVTFIQRCTGIPVSVGLGSTKTRAKLACHICKKRQITGRVFNIDRARSLETILAHTTVEDIWGIGRRWAQQLNAQKIHTAFDLYRMDPETMRKRHGVVMQRIILELQGISCLESDDITAKKQIIASRSFGQRVTQKNDLIEAMTQHTTRAAEKLRTQQSVCGALQVSIRTSKHHSDGCYNRASTFHFPVATADTRKLITAACTGVEKIFKAGPHYAKAGVMLFNIEPDAQRQGELFDVADSQAAQQLMHTLDQINQRYGKHTLFFASEGTQKSWATNSRHMTQAFTTRWDQLPVVG